MNVSWSLRWRITNHASCSYGSYFQRNYTLDKLQINRNTKRLRISVIEYSIKTDDNCLANNLWLQNIILLNGFRSHTYLHHETSSVNDRNSMRGDGFPPILHKILAFWSE